MKGVRERITVNKVVYVPLCFETPSELYNVCGKAFELAICLWRFKYGKPKINLIFVKTRVANKEQFSIWNEIIHHWRKFKIYETHWIKTNQCNLSKLFI